MNELEHDIDAEIIARFAERLAMATESSDRFERLIRDIAPGCVGRDLWLHCQGWGDHATTEATLRDLMQSWAVPAVKGDLVETRDTPIADRLAIMIGVMDEKIRMLGGSAIKAHEMKATKLQRAIIETCLHADYKACYTIRKMCVDTNLMILNRPSHPSRKP